MPEDESTINRRNVLRIAGSSLTAIGALGIGGVRASGDEPPTEETTKDLDVGTQAMTGSSSKFTDYDIYSYETTTLKSSWNFFSPVPTGNTYQLDIIIQSDNIERPQTVARNIDDKDVDKQWVRSTDPALGNIYHWQTKSEYVYDFGGASRFLDARITPTSSGDVRVKTGTYFPWDFWSEATLTIY